MEMEIKAMKKGSDGIFHQQQSAKFNEQACSVGEIGVAYFLQTGNVEISLFDRKKFQFFRQINFLPLSNLIFI